MVSLSYMSYFLKHTLYVNYVIFMIPYICSFLPGSALKLKQVGRDLHSKSSWKNSASRCSCLVAGMDLRSIRWFPFHNTRPCNLWSHRCYWWPQPHLHSSILLLHFLQTTPTELLVNKSFNILQFAKTYSENYVIVHMQYCA